MPSGSFQVVASDDGDDEGGRGSLGFFSSDIVAVLVQNKSLAR